MTRFLFLAAALPACTPAADDVLAPPPPPSSATPVCGLSTDLLDAPPLYDSAIGPLSAIDLLWVDAIAVVTDTPTVAIDAEARFLVGDQGGRPTFELAADSLVELDGVEVELERVSVSNPPREVVVLPDLDPCTEHTLRVTHEVDETWFAGQGGQVRLEPLEDGVFWAAGLEDDAAGKFLGMWTPSNLLFDRFDLDVSFDIDAVTGDHQLVTTGQESADDPWHRQWTGVQAHAPFWVLSPVSQTQSLTHEVVLSETTVQLEIYALTTDLGADIEEARDRAEVALQDFDRDYGAYHHGNRYVLWIRSEQGSMEYDGATLTAMGAIEHEIMHSWFARGASPVADLHGWIDEAMTSWVTDLLPYRAIAINYDSTPVLLQVGDDEWAGAELSVNQYLFGSSIFADIAVNHSVEEVRDAMGVFYRAHAGDSYRASDIEEHLTCWFDDERVRDAFHHRAYGGTDPGPRPEHWCQGNGAL